MADLNAVRDAIKRNQRRGDPFPNDIWNKAFVDPDGEIVLGRDPKARDGRPKSEIHQGVFAC